MKMLKLFKVFQITLLVMITITFFVVGPVIEQKLMPVISRFEIPEEAIKNMEDGSTEIFGIFTKERGSCEVIRGSLTVFADQFVPDDNIPAKEISVNNEVLTNGKSFPAGSQYFGPWILTPPNRPFGPSIVIRIRHKCHPFWVTETVLYRGLTSDFFNEERIVGDEPPWKNGETND